MHSPSAHVAAGAAVLAAGTAYAADVLDRTTSIKIKSLKPTVTGPKVYVKIDTNHGIFGWGEITGSEPKVAATLCESLFELLDGENPTRDRISLAEAISLSSRHTRRSVHGACDLGHRHGPVGHHRQAVGGARLPAAGRAGARQDPPLPDAQGQKTGHRRAASVFGHAQAEIEGLVRGRSKRPQTRRPGRHGDVRRPLRVPPPMLLQFASRIEPSELLFLEEPAVPGNIEVFKRLKEHIRIPIATGERDRTIWEVIPYLQNRCIDILQPDCGQTGGITQMREDRHPVRDVFHADRTALHNARELGLSASLHVTAAACPYS